MTQTQPACKALLAILFAAFLSSSRAIAAVPSLEWDPNPEPYVVGYNVYIGEKSRVYTRVIDVGQQTSVPLTNLNPGVTYYFAVTAYDTSRLESPFSDEVSYTPRIDGTNAFLIPFAMTMEGGNALIRFPNIPGHMCRIVASSDLFAWEEIHSLRVPDDRVIEYVDANPELRAQRFFRVVAAPVASASSTIVAY
jgi:hypothetical protein